MTGIEKCLKQVTKVRAVAQKKEVAYVARSRIGRLVLTLAQLASRIADLPIPDRLGRLLIPENAPDDVRILMEICNRLTDTTRTLVQPSEPLDMRWQSGWSELVKSLDRIEQHLMEIKVKFPP